MDLRPVIRTRHMADRGAIASLVDDMKKIDRAARALETYNHRHGSHASAELAATFDEAQRVFDARVAALTEEERWQLMFTAMVSGALQDE